MRTVLALWVVAMSVLPALGGTYTNPIISADIPDPDVIRVGTDYYMTSSSFNLTPGLPVFYSIYARGPVFETPSDSEGCGGV